MAVFELGGALAPGLPELMVGPWTNAPPGIAAFDVRAAQPESLWRVDLARDDAASQAALAGGERSVARTHAVLDEVPRRFDRALGRALDRPLGRTLGEPAREARPGPARDDHRRVFAPEPPPELDLIAALAGPEAHPPPRPDLRTAWSVASPGVPGSSRQEPGWLEQAIERITDLARGRARIETHVEGALVAHSIMTLSGDTEIWVAPRLSLSGARLHTRSVAVAVRTRHAWARILALIMGGGGRILALGLPAAGLAALPLAWRFVRDVLRGP